MMPVSDFRTTLDRLHACSGVCLLIYLGVPKKHALMSVLNIMFRFSLINDTSSQMTSIGTALAYYIIRENVSGKVQKEREHENLQVVGKIDQIDLQGAPVYQKHASVHLMLILV